MKQPYSIKITNTNIELKRVRLFYGKENATAANFGNESCIAIECEREGFTYLQMLTQISAQPIISNRIFSTERTVFSVKKKDTVRSIIAYPFPNSFDSDILEIDNETEVFFTIPGTSSIVVEICPE